MRPGAAIILVFIIPQLSLRADPPVNAAPTPSTGDQLVVEVTEELLNQLVTHRHTTLRPVQDVILEAQVFGQEQTSTQLRIDLTPSRDGAAAEFRLSGRTASDTMGYTPQAAVHTLGDNSFSAAKLVVFDGTMFRTQRPRVQVLPHSDTLCASTPADGAPFFGPMFASFAFQMAQARRPEADFVVADRISRRVGAEFNSEVDQQLATLNRGWLRQVRPWLVQTGWLPTRTRASSSGEMLYYAANFQNSSSRLLPVPPPLSNAQTPSRLNRLAVHESLLNFALASLNLEGLQFSPEQLDEFLQPANEFLNDLTVEPLPALPSAPVSPTTPDGVVVQLDRQHPVRVALRDGELHIQLRASFSLPLGVTTPLQTIHIRETFQPDEPSFLLAPVDVSVQPAAAETAQPDMISAAIRSQVRSRVPTIRIPRRISVPSASGAEVVLSVREPLLRDGWLVLEVE